VRFREPFCQNKALLPPDRAPPTNPPVPNKAAGNAALQADPGVALEQYTKALSLLAWFGASGSWPHLCLFDRPRVSLTGQAGSQNTDKRTAREDEERVMCVTLAMQI
jgi:hypothetical protein